MACLQVFLAVLVMCKVMCQHHPHQQHQDKVCSSHSCHHGRCHMNGDHHYCVCDPGYTGKHCTDHIVHQPQTQTPQPGLVHGVGESATTTLRTTVAPTRPAPTMSTSSTPIQVSTGSTISQKSSSTTPNLVTPSSSPVNGLLHSPTCDKFGTVSELANQDIAQNRSAAQCPSGSYTSPEAFTLHNCQTSLPPFWKPGRNVVQFCSSIPLYTPIAEFGPIGYMSSYQTITGVLVGCLSQPDGFKIAMQTCDSVPDIQTFMVGGPTDPSSFFVVMY